jgi:hypothetical protein
LLIFISNCAARDRFGTCTRILPARDFIEQEPR